MPRKHRRDGDDSGGRGGRGRGGRGRGGANGPWRGVEDDFGTPGGHRNRDTDRDNDTDRDDNPDRDNNTDRDDDGQNPGDGPPAGERVHGETNIANRMDRTQREIADAIHAVKNQGGWRGFGANKNPDVSVDPVSGEVYPQLPDGTPAEDSIGNLYDYLPKRRR